MSDMDYISGLIDAEGYIGITTNIIKGSVFYRPEISVGMTCQPVVEYLQETFNGCLFSRVRPPNKKLFTWRANGLTTQGVLNECMAALCVKRQQAELIAEYLEITKGTRIYSASQKTEMHRIYTSMKHLNKKGLNKQFPLAFPKPTVAYWAGLFDGEGAISLSRRKDTNSFIPEISLSIGCKVILEQLQDRYGGNVSKYNNRSQWADCFKWKVSTPSDTTQFIDDILPLSRVKSQQLAKMREFLSIRSASSYNHLTFSEIGVLQTLRDEMKLLNAA